MTYKYIKTALAIGLLFLVYACRKDIGNYDYQEINKVKFAGIDSVYFGLLGERFQINPKLDFTLDPAGNEADYNYEWIALNMGSSVLPKDQKNELAKTRNLDITLKVPPGPYKVYYTVTDKKTGVAYTRMFRLNVETSIYEGWMVLNDVNGAARLDMVTKIKDVYKPVADILGTTGSELVLQGKPVDVYCYPYSRTVYGVYVSTDQRTDRVDPETFKWKNTFNIKYEMVSNVPDNFHADFISGIIEENANSYMYANGNVYYNFATYQLSYGTPINLLKGETAPFKTAPFVPAARDPKSLNATAVLFDTAKKRFLKHSNHESNCNPMLKQDNAFFDYNDVGMDLMYMDYSPFGGGDVFAVLKDPAGKVYLTKFNMFSGIQNYFSEMTGPEITKAEKFAISPVYGYLFYSAGGRVYEYDTSLKTTKLMLDKGAEQISLMKFQPFRSTGSSRPYYQSRRNQLLVASYNPALPAGKNGKMELYVVPGLNADLSLGESYDGFGKIVSISYRER